VRFAKVTGPETGHPWPGLAYPEQWWEEVSWSIIYTVILFFTEIALYLFLNLD
jgi:hypothetical protein